MTPERFQQIDQLYQAALDQECCRPVQVYQQRLCW